jgi:hypothetical protein
MAAKELIAAELYRALPQILRDLHNIIADYARVACKSTSAYLSEPER